MQPALYPEGTLAKEEQVT